MMTARKRVGPLPTHHLAVRHSVNHSSSYSSSEASSNFHLDASSDSSSRHSLPDHSSTDLPSTSAGPSRKRHRSPMTSVPALPLVSGAVSPVRADLIPSPKRIRSPETAIDLEGCLEDSFEPYVPREVGLGVDVKDESTKPSRSRVADLEMDVDVMRSDGIEIDPEIQAEINECFAYADALRDRGIDARVVVERVTHPVMSEDTPEPAQEGAVEVTYETLGDLGHRIVGVESAVTALTKRIAELERDNRRLRDTANVESQRVDRLQRGMSRMQRELRQIRQFRFYDRVRVGRFEVKMPNTRSGASMTHEEVEEMVTHRVAEEMEAREAARTIEPLNENGDEQESKNGGNGNGGNRGNGNGGNGGNGNGGNGNGRNGENGVGNRNGNHGMNYGGFMPVARECTFLDFLKCKPHNFSGTEGVVGLTRWFKKMETVFNISNFPSKYQVKYATCTLQDNALTGWNSHRVQCKNVVDGMWLELHGWGGTMIRKGNADLTHSAISVDTPYETCEERMSKVEKPEPLNRVGNKTGNQTGGNEATAKAYAIGGGGTNPDFKLSQSIVYRLLREKMPNTRSRASMTHEEFEELVTRRVAEEMEAREAARTLEPLNENVDEQEGENGGNGNGGNGNGGNGENGNGNRNGNHGTEGVDSALTWWNSHKRTIGVEAAYAMNWVELMKLMTEELILLCTRMVPDEEDRVERFIRGLPDNIQRNVIVANPARLQDVIRIANQLMDKKVQGYAARSAENKRRMESNLRDNRGQQPPFKRQNTSGKNVARAYTAGNNERKGYARTLPYCNKCRMHHEGLCTMRCGNCKKIGYQTRDCRAAIALNTQKAPVGNQQGIICYECGRPRHFRKDCPKAYAIGGGGTNPDSNVVTGTFLLNNCYASMLFDSGADRSFVSTTFSALLDVAPSTLDTSYAVELSDGKFKAKFILGMERAAKFHALIVCDEKVVRIPYGDEVLIIRGDNCDGRSKLNIISCTRTQKYIHEGCQVYLAQVTSKKVEDKSEEKRLEDVPIVRKFPEVFPEDLPGLPPA
ncbi:putative reverse transcriptase domain-containing protein [Tanacetum coccineum]|uniref:Reverse transcriptase domain-containing protein n=1 Tax=Tanacetum coccineum TaxID=301880 RepID=A0ABQ4Z9W6_9ASTR